MKIKFKNGYSVEINDAYLTQMPKREIIRRAREVVDGLCADDTNEPMIIIKKIKTSNGYKVVIIKNDTITGVKRFGVDSEEEAQDFYDKLADKYNLDEEGYDNFGKTKIAAPAKYFKMQAQDSVKRKAVKDMFEPIETFKTFDFLDRTRQGFKVIQAYEDLDDGRMHVICYRPSDKTYIIGLGYNADTGVWNQGDYDYRTFGDAERTLKRNYNVDMYEIDLSKFEDKVKVEDTPIEFTEELGFAVTPTAIKKFVSKKDGHILDPRAFSKTLSYLENDLDYDIDVRANNWSKATPDMQPMIDRTIQKYDEFVDELDKIDDTQFNDRAQAIIDKVELLKTIVYNVDDTSPDVNPEEDKLENTKTTKGTTPVVKEKVTEKYTVKPFPDINKEDEDEIPIEDACKDEACHDADVDDIYIEDVPFAGATIHASVEGAPEHSFNKSMIVRGNSRALSENPKDAEYGRRILNGEYEDVKQTLLYDIAHAGDVAAATPKYLLRMGMEKYKEIIDLYNVPGLEQEYAELVRLYNKLYYNGYYLGVRN